MVLESIPHRRATAGTLRLWLTLCLSLLTSADLSLQAADTSEEPANASPATAADSANRPAMVTELETKRTELSTQRRRLEDILARRTSSSTDTADDGVRRELDLVKFHESLCIQQLAELSLTGELRASLAEAQQQQHDLQLAGPEEPPPHSILFWDDLCDQCDSEQINQQSLTVELSVAKDMQQSAARMRENAEKNRRELKEACENSDDPANRQAVAARFDHATLNCETLAALVHLRRMEVANRDLELQVSRVRGEYLAAKRSAVAPNVEFTREQLAEVRQVMARIEAERQSQIPVLQTRLQELSEREARTLPSLTTESHEVQEQITEGWRRARQGIKQQLSLIQQRLREIGMMRSQWDVRFKVHNGMAIPEQITAWAKETRQYHERIAANRQLLEAESRALLLDLGRAEKRALLDRQTNEGPVPPLREFQLACMQDLARAYSTNLVQLESMEHMLGRLLDTLSVRSSANGVMGWMNWSRQAFVAIWQYEITSVDDRPITVRKVALSVILLVIGVFVSRHLSRLMGKRILPHTGMNLGASAAIQTISFYVLVVGCGYISLELVHIPLTVFTFLGGAVAIGVGFGSQNILNNFFSGLILLTEQPVRMGDLVEIDGLCGVIEKIGTRSTRVRTGANLELIIPNSKFLENNVTNWTLSDTRTRLDVRVGVAYGSSPATVQQVLQRAVTNSEGVLPSPAPFVVFSDFGDNTLMFEVHFWTEVRSMTQARIIESNVRLTIDRFFTENQIVVAFPQRDIHLDTSRPLDVRMLPAAEDEALQLYRHAS